MKTSKNIRRSIETIKSTVLVVKMWEWSTERECREDGWREWIEQEEQGGLELDRENEQVEALQEVTPPKTTVVTLSSLLERLWL